MSCIYLKNAEVTRKNAHFLKKKIELQSEEKFWKKLIEHFSYSIREIISLLHEVIAHLRTSCIYLKNTEIAQKNSHLIKHSLEL